MKDGNTKYLAISSGFIEVYAEKISIITDQAILVDEDDHEAIEAAIKKAEQALEEGKNSNFDETQLQMLEAAAKFEQARKLAKGEIPLVSFEELELFLFQAIIFKLVADSCGLKIPQCFKFMLCDLNQIVSL